VFLSALYACEIRSDLCIFASSASLAQSAGNTPAVCSMELDEVDAWELLGYGTSGLHGTVDEETLGCIEV